MTTAQGALIYHIRERDAASGLGQYIVRYTRNEVRRVFADTYLLAQKPFSWITQAAYLLHGQKATVDWEFAFGELLALWESAVSINMHVAERDIATAIYSRSVIVKQPPEVKIIIVGTGQVKLQQCPLPMCFGKIVDYQPVLPDAFRTTFLDRLKRVPPFNGCDHRIPVPMHAQRIIANRLDVYQRNRS